MFVEDMDGANNCYPNVTSENENYLLYDKIWVINLDSSTSRWKTATRYLNQTDLIYERFSAINGYEVQIEDMQTHKSFLGKELKTSKDIMQKDKMYNITCNPKSVQPTQFNLLGPIAAGELGLWCSYIIIWKDALAKNYRNIIIFEDDIKLIKPSSFVNDINKFISNLPSFDFAFLNSRIHEGKQIHYNSYVNSVTSNYMGYGTDSVIYSARGIEKFLSVDYLTRVIDVFIWNHQLGTENNNTNQVVFESYISSKNLVSTMGASILEKMGGRS